MTKSVLILAGSDGDRERLEACFATLDEARVTWEFVVSSAHRDAEQTAEIAKAARAKGYQVIICAAGLAAALSTWLAAAALWSGV